MLVARTEGPLRALQAQYPDRVRYVTGDLGGEQFGAVVREAVRAGVTSTTTTTTTTTTDAPGVAAGGGGGARLVGLVVNHARFGPVGRVADISVEDWADGLRVNFLSCVEFVSGPEQKNNSHFTTYPFFFFGLRLSGGGFSPLCGMGEKIIIEVAFFSGKIELTRGNEKFRKNFAKI